MSTRRFYTRGKILPVRVGRHVVAGLVAFALIVAGMPDHALAETNTEGRGCSLPGTVREYPKIQAHLPGAGISPELQRRHEVADDWNQAKNSFSAGPEACFQHSLLSFDPLTKDEVGRAVLHLGSSDVTQAMVLLRNAGPIFDNATAQRQSATPRGGPFLIGLSKRQGQAVPSLPHLADIRTPLPRPPIVHGMPTQSGSSGQAPQSSAKSGKRCRTGCKVGTAFGFVLIGLGAALIATAEEPAPKASIERAFQHPYDRAWGIAGIGMGAGMVVASLTLGKSY